jgi:hypothetical protein
MRIILAAAALLIVFAPPLLLTADNWENVPVDPSLEKIRIDVECHSGTPPVLEFVLTDPASRVRSVEFDFDGDGVTDVTADGWPQNVLFRGIPYRRPGVHTVACTIHTDGGTLRRRVEIGFTEYRWGVNNFRFANDGEYENFIDFVSLTTLEWAQARFGELSPGDKILLLSFMYSMYRGSIGRCYGFTGGQIFYLDHPDALPPLYDSVYQLSERDDRIVRQMDFVQNDIVFSNFLSGKIQIEGNQSEEDLRSQLETIVRSVRRGRAIILGYISPRMHHSMVVYGYFRHIGSDRITLLVANNWEREQDNNTFSEDAENIVVDLTGSRPYMSWFDLTKKRRRYPKKIFAIPLEDRYDLKREQLDALLDSIRSRLVKERKSVVLVEKTEVAYVVDGEGKRRGYIKPKTLFELHDVVFKKIDYNYVFEVPLDGVYELHLEKRRYNEELGRYKPVNLFFLAETDNGEVTFRDMDIPLSDDEERVYVIDHGTIRLGSEAGE